jgi:Spy/CpxP family protein refolding chaperone
VSSGTPGFRVALLLLVTLAAGAAGGVAIDRRFDAPAQTEHGTRGSEGRGETTIERFADELGLTEEQRQQIAPVLEDTRTRMSEVFDKVRPEYRRVVDSARAQIEALLTPDQVTMYRSLLESEDDESGDSSSEASDGE